MPRILSIDQVDSSRQGDVSPFEEQMAAFFVAQAEGLHLPRSLALIYAMVFCAPQPIATDKLQYKTGISKGRLSEGLQWLLNSGLILAQRIEGDRRTYYQPEMSLRKWLGSLFSDALEPRLAKNLEAIASLRAFCDQDLETPLEPVVSARLNSLAQWNRRGSRILPLILKGMGVNRSK